MESVFERVANGDNIDGIPLYQLQPYQLAAYVQRVYPGDSKGALRILRDNHEIGGVLYDITLALLEGVESAERN